MDKNALKSTAYALVAPGKGILAADESFPTIKKRFDTIGIESTKETRRSYRELLFTTSEIEKYISGVIMFDESIRQSTKGNISFPELLSKRGIIPGIKVDQGKDEMDECPGEMLTKGLEGLEERLREYCKLGAKFTKWRAVFSINKDTPTDTCIKKNSEHLAKFALLSQNAGMVPVVEPEVLMKGDHDFDKSRQVTMRVLKSVFIYLGKYKIDLSGVLLKPSWVHPGLDRSEKPSSEEVAKATLVVFREVLPDELPGVVFLSGGDSPEDSTSHLDALNELDQTPWQLSFSFGRALQAPVLKTWEGKSENVVKAQNEFVKRARLNSLARTGRYEESMEGFKDE
jgi:fructose-bisphosphate aldolase class I